MTANPYSAVGSGISSQIMYAIETAPTTAGGGASNGTWGVFPTAVSGNVGTFRALEFKSETLALKKTTVQGQGLHAGGLFDRLSRRVLTNYDAGGAITFDLPNRNLNALLWAMTGSPNSTLTGVSGSSGPLYFPAQISTTGAYQSYHSPGSTGGISLAIQKGVPSADAPGSTVVEPFSYVGAKISDWEISVDTGAIVQCVLTFDCRNELGGTGNTDPLNGSIPTLQAFSEGGISSATDTLNVFHFRQATLFTATLAGISAGNILTISASSAANIKSASFKETKSLDTSRYYIGSSGFKAEQVENGFRKLSGTFVAEFLSAETYYNAFSADSTTGLQLTFTGSTAGTAGANADTLNIIFPTIKLDGESPHIGGPGVITQSVAFTGLDDNSTSPYQIKYVSSDSAV